jgi:hypothetical protein
LGSGLLSCCNFRLNAPFMVSLRVNPRLQLLTDQWPHTRSPHVEWVLLIVFNKS